MLSKVIQKELESRLETALMAAEPGISVHDLAERMYHSEPALTEEIKCAIAIERFIWMITRQKQHLPSKDQMSFPGWPELPIRIRLKNGKRPLLMRATLADLKQFRTILLKQKGTRLKIVERLIALMEPYAAKQPTITVTTVLAKETGLQS